MKRWLDTRVSPELRRVLQSAAEDARPGAIARLERRLGRALGASAVSGVTVRPDAASQGAPGLSGATAGGTAASVKVVLALAAAGVLGALALRTSAPQPPRTETPARSTATLAAPSVAPAPAAARASADVAEPAAPAQLPPVVEPRQPAAPPSPPRVEQLRMRPASRATAHAPASQLSDEVRQLDAIRRYLRVDTARALAAADAHERRFPNGALGEERELLRIEALLRLGRTGEAQVRARALGASPAGKAYRRQLQRLLARYAHAPDG